MPEPRDAGRAERAQLTEQDLVIAALVGRYIERRENNASPGVHDLLAVAAEIGEVAIDALRTVLACYEAMRAYRDDGAGRERAEG